MPGFIEVHCTLHNLFIVRYLAFQKQMYLLIFFFSASDCKAELQAALWKIPADFDSSISDDTSSNAPSLEKLTQLGTPEQGEIKTYFIKFV